MKYYSLQHKKTGELLSTISGKVLVTTHRLTTDDDYRAVELVIKETKKKKK